MIEQEVNWRLTIRAALIVTAVGLGIAGVFQFNRIGCRLCWQDVTKHFFAFFGYFAAFGFAIGWTLPEGADEIKGRPIQWNTRRGFWEGSLGTAAIFSVIYAALHFLS